MAEHRSDKDYDDEDEPSKGLGLRIPPIRTFLHFLYMKRWHVLVLWLFLAIPTGILLSLFDLPNSYVSRTVVRFPSVVGAQVNMMRDVAITQKESIISTFESFQVLERTADRLRLRLRVVTPDIFRERTIRDITYSPALGEGVYRLNFAANRQVTVFFRPENGVTEYELARTPVGSDGRLSISGLELEFLPEFLRIAEGMDLRLRFQSQYKTVKALREALRIRPMGSVNYSIALEDRDPWLVSRIVNTLTEEFLKVYYGTTEVQDVSVLVQMEKNIDLAKQRLERSQEELDQFYRQHPQLMRDPDEDSRPADQMVYLELQNRRNLLQAGQERIRRLFGARPENNEEEKVFWAVEMLSALGDAGEPKANIVKSALSSSWQKQKEARVSLSPGHPRLKEFEDERVKTYEEVESLYKKTIGDLERRDAELLARMGQHMSKGQSRPSVKVELELDRLSSAYKNNQDLYDKLMDSYNRAKLTTGSEFFKVTVVDEARPALYEAPSLERRLIVAGVSVVALIFFAPVPFLLWPLMLGRIWTRDDIERFLRLPVLGTVIQKGMLYPKRAKPRSGVDVGDAGTVQSAERQGHAEGLDPFLIHYGKAHLLEDIENFRFIREEVETLFRTPKSPNRLSVLVTSCRPFEGKSQCAANLAISFARKGRKTLLIDADFRLGRLGDMFCLQAENGLADLLRRDDVRGMDFAEAAVKLLYETPQQGLVVVPKGAGIPSAGEAVGSRRFHAFLHAVRGKFEVVVIDSPPLIVTADPLSVLEAVDGVVFVTRSGLTPVGEAREAVEKIRTRGVLAGAILNGCAATPLMPNQFRKYGYYYRAQPKEEAGASR